MARHSFITIATAFAGFLTSGAATTGQKYPYPNIAQTSHSTSHAVNFLERFFTYKSVGNGDAFVKLWNTQESAYYDSTLGKTIVANHSQLIATFAGNSTPTGLSYPLRILGDTVGGAIVYFVDTPGLFGAEVRTISTFDFVNGTIARQLDNWDGRDNAVKGVFPPDPQYPDLGLPGLPEKAAATMQTVSRKINAALAAGNAAAAAALFSPDAVFEDLTLRARVEGQIAIAAYLNRTLSAGLPYGPGTQVTHVVGNAVGGGYEWRPSGNTVKYGITALELDGAANITSFTATWDGSRVSAAVLQKLAVLAPTP